MVYSCSIPNHGWLFSTMLMICLQVRRRLVSVGTTTGISWNTRRASGKSFDLRGVRFSCAYLLACGCTWAPRRAPACWGLSWTGPWTWLRGSGTCRCWSPPTGTYWTRRSSTREDLDNSEISRQLQILKNDIQPRFVMFFTDNTGVGSYPRSSWAQSPKFWSCSEVPLQSHRSRCTWPGPCPPEGGSCTAAWQLCSVVNWLRWPFFLTLNACREWRGWASDSESQHLQTRMSCESHKNVWHSTLLLKKKKTAMATAASVIQTTTCLISCCFSSHGLSQ